MSNNIARHWIDGAWVTSDRVSPSINPSDGEILGRFADGGGACCELTQDRLTPARGSGPSHAGYAHSSLLSMIDRAAAHGRVRPIAISVKHAA